MAITYGTSEIRKKSYRVYIAEADTSGLDTAFDDIIGNSSTAYIDAAIALMSEFGECRDDSISVTGEDGETIQGNVVGNIVINKACSFSAELINSTPDNIDAIEALDGVAVSVLLVEKDSHMDGATEKKLAIIIKNKNLSYTENITGGDTGRGTISLSSSPRKIDDFRTIVDCEVLA
jgi:hypothetical protein